MIDVGEIYKWHSLFVKSNSVVEIRSFGDKTYSGYYKDVNNIIRDVTWLDSLPNQQIYFIMNQVNPDCYSRPQREKLMQSKTTTNDKDIIGRNFILVDLDPKRTTGVGSSEEELQFARVKAANVYKFLLNNGFNEPIVAMSGNGYHIMIPCAFPNTEEVNNTIKRFLNALSMIFSDDKVEVDTVNFNAARICKLYGTVAKKGYNSNERPHRMSKIVKIPDVIKNVERQYIEKIANMYPDDVKPSVDNNWGRERFDVVEFLNKHNIAYKEYRTTGGVKYILDSCVFDSNHKGKDAAIFQRDNGALAYHCFHNSCSQYTWKDVRLKFEPDAYDKKSYAEFQHKQRYYGNVHKEPFKPEKETTDKGKKWLSMKDIEYVDVSTLPLMETGYPVFDKKMMGLLLGDITILSGISGAGKSSFVDCLILNVIQRGHKVAAWSGELQDFRFQNWINQIAAGKSYVKKRVGFDDVYYCPRETSDKISNWLDGKLFLYNNSYGNKWEQLFNDIKEVVENEGVELLVLDNLMSLDIKNLDGDKNDRQSEFINQLKSYAKEKNVHIILVCHPRKENFFLRMESISGSADIFNLCDNCLIIHRVGKDFQTRGEQFLGKEVIEEYKKYDSVIEICKNRAMGVKDFLVGLYYERESRRLKSDIAEHINYGWIEEDNDFVITKPVSVQLQPNTNFDNPVEYANETITTTNYFEENYGLPY